MISSRDRVKGAKNVYDFSSLWLGYWEGVPLFLFQVSDFNCDHLDSMKRFSSNLQLDIVAKLLPAFPLPSTPSMPLT